MAGCPIPHILIPSYGEHAGIWTTQRFGVNTHPWMAYHMSDIVQMKGKEQAVRQLLIIKQTFTKY
jgi:hypothetical protein